MCTFTGKRSPVNPTRFHSIPNPIHRDQKTLVVVVAGQKGTHRANVNLIIVHSLEWFNTRLPFFPGSFASFPTRVGTLVAYMLDAGGGKEWVQQLSASGKWNTCQTAHRCSNCLAAVFIGFCTWPCANRHAHAKVVIDRQMERIAFAMRRGKYWNLNRLAWF